MKIAIPTDEKSMDTTVCPSFGRTPYYLIYNTETRESVFLDNSASGSQGGAGIKAAQFLIDQGVSATLAPRLGENAAEVLKRANISLYKTSGSNVRENVDAFIEGKLSLLDKIHAGFHNHG